VLVVLTIILLVRVRGAFLLSYVLVLGEFLARTQTQARDGIHSQTVHPINHHANEYTVIVTKTLYDDACLHTRRQDVGSRCAL
jgi:hypothetical protein